MKVIINGENETLADGTTVLAMLDARGLTGRRLAMEVNGEIVPRSQFAEHELRDGDTLEIVHAVGGG